MKTLKKALCLILALTMVVGVLAFSASAADFKDADKIEYDEAVAVLTGIGAISGRDDGTYDPTAGLQRQEGVAIVVRALLKRATADKLSGGGGYYNDVDAKSWSAGYIEYATDKGILNGVGNGKFDPRGELTGYAFAKMLLAANGIKGEFTGNAWKNNVLIAADENGFTKKMASDFNYAAPITRDEAAAMAYNAIQYSAEGEKSSYVVKVGDTELYNGTDSNEALLMTLANSGATLSKSTVRPGSIAAQYGYAEDTETDAFGRVSKQITNGKSGDDKKVYYSTPSDLVKEYTEGVTYGKIVSDLGYSKVADTVKFSVYDNSKTETKSVTAHKTDTTKDYAVGGAGTLVQVYKTATKDTYQVVIIDTHVAVLDGETNKIFAATKATSTKDATKAYITIDGKNYETDAFKRGDVVLYTVADKAIQSVTKADYISGAITATASSYVRIDGDKYVKSAHANVADKFWTLNSTTNTYYLDNYKNVIYAKEGKTAAVDTDYIYVVATASKAAKSDSSDLFSTVAGTAAVAQAKVVDLDNGATSVVNRGIVVNSSGSYLAQPNGSASTTLIKDETSTAGASNAGIWSYATLADGSIALDAKQGETTVILGASGRKAEIGIAGKYANSATMLTVLEITKDKSGNFSSAKVTKYTGYNNFPSLNGVKAVVEYSSSNPNLATKIIVVKGAETAASVANYAVYTGAGETIMKDGKQVAQGNFSVKGETKSYALNSSDTFVVGNVYDISVSSDNTASIKSNITNDFKAKDVKVDDVQEGFVVIGTNIVNLASDAVIIDAGDEYAVTTLEAGDKISYTVNSKGELNFAVIAKAE